jgi:uncharacterized protein with NRDE domain
LIAKDLLRGGTWMAMNKKNGKIGVLLNILQPEAQILHDKESRGKLKDNSISNSEIPITILFSRFSCC